MYTGNVYLGFSGQWAWAVLEEGITIAAGAGYDTEEDAEVDMLCELESQKGE